MMETPILKTNAGACDCHVHIYEDKYPLAPTAPFKPPHAPVSDYRKVQQALGVTRAIIVQPTGYGFDNRCTEDALKQLGDDARGICVVPPDVSDAELARLNAAGFRGVRYMMLGALLPWESLPQMSRRVAALGWVINLQLDGRDLPQYAAMVGSLRSRVVIDHTGKFLEPVSVDSESFKTLLRLLDNGGTWVKLSAPYETSRNGPPHYEDVSVLARTLAKTHPDRCLWASNWPHPNRNPAPSNAALFDLLLEWTDDETTRQRILVENPAELFGFGD